MVCLECGGNLVERVQGVPFESKVLGRVIIPDIKVETCTRCNRYLLFPGESEKVAQYVLTQESVRVAQERFSDFVSLNEAAAILDHSKQAFNKNKKIARGFIMGAELDHRRFYLRASVELFKSVGDGRFLLDPIQIASSSPFACYVNPVKAESIPLEFQVAEVATEKVTVLQNRSVA